MFLRGYTGISLSVRQSICVSICVRNTTFCQSAGRGIKSHLVTALVWLAFYQMKKKLRAFLNNKMNAACMMKV